MTVIAGIIGKNRATLAADSQAGIGYANFNTSSKLYDKGEVIVGFAGDFLFSRALQLALPLQDGSSVWSVHEWCYELQASVREHADGRDFDDDSYIMLAVSPSGLFVMAGDGAVVKVEAPYFAIGSGGPVALGALSVVTPDSDALQESALTEAIAAASRHDPYCGGRIDIMGIEWGKE